MRTAFALPIRVSISLFRLSSLVNTTPRSSNVSTCCSVSPLICRINCLGRLERHNTSIFLVLIFVPAWSCAAENRSNACWRPCWEDPRMQYQFVSKKQTVHPAVPNSYTLVDVLWLSKPGVGKQRPAGQMWPTTAFSVARQSIQDMCSNHSKC